MNCSVSTCGGVAVAKNLCMKHYQRLRKHGDPNITKQVQFHGLTLRERFFKYVKKNNDGCWPWLGSKDRRGYGRINENGIPLVASRVSWEVHNGPIPKGRCVLHKCDNPECTNPEHLYVGDHLDNMNDMWSRGRANPGVSLGEKHGNSKLNADAVRDIRTSKEAWKTLQERYGVSSGTISAVRKRKTWNHVE